MRGKRFKSQVCFETYAATSMICFIKRDSKNKNRLHLKEVLKPFSFMTRTLVKLILRQRGKINAFDAFF